MKERTGERMIGMKLVKELLIWTVIVVVLISLFGFFIGPLISLCLGALSGIWDVIKMRRVQPPSTNEHVDQAHLEAAPSKEKDIKKNKTLGEYTERD